MSDERYIAVHKEFTREHQIVNTLAYRDDEGDSLKSVQAWCDKANANGFNYRPYPASEFLPLEVGAMKGKGRKQ